MADTELTGTAVPAKSHGWAALLALGIAALAIAGWLITQHGRESVAGAGNGERSSLQLETFVVNLSDQEQRSYLRVGIDLGLGRQLAKGESPPLGRVRDTILGVLAQYGAADLLTPAGKGKLKQQLLHELQERVPDLQVQEVYFNEFLIQR